MINEAKFDVYLLKAVPFPPAPFPNEYLAQKNLIQVLVIVILY
jgi:hypothetical protein